MMRTRSRQFDSRAGITLAELAMVIFLLSLLFTMLFSTVMASMRVMETFGPQGTEKAEVFLALRNIRSTINQTYHSGDVRQLWFVGAPDDNQNRVSDRLTLAAVHPNAEDLGTAAVREVSFYLRDNEPDSGLDPTLKSLVRREDSMVDEDAGRGGLHYVLLTNVEVLNLKYSYSGNSNEFSREWDSRDNRRIPRIIHIILKVRVGDRSETYETYARPGLYLR